MIYARNSADSYLPIEDWREWFHSSKAGDRISYFRGYIPTALEDGASDLGDLVAITSTTRDASEKQLVHLVQRRHGERDYEYIAIRRNDSDSRKSYVGSLGKKYDAFKFVPSRKKYGQNSEAPIAHV